MSRDRHPKVTAWLAASQAWDGVSGPPPDLPSPTLLGMDPRGGVDPETDDLIRRIIGERT